MKMSKKVISLLLVLSMTIPLCVGCAKTVKEESENNEQANKVIEEAKSKLKEVEETKESTGVVSDGDGWTLWDEDGHLTSGDRDATGKNGVVSAAKYEASQAGLEVLKAGGNAIDAAVAVAFALSVIEQNASGIGGGGSMMIRTEEGENVFIAFRGDAPSAASPDMWVVENGKVANKANRQGGKAVTIPGEVAGLLYAFDNYGSGNLTLEQVMAPAINLAQNGFYVTPTLYKDMVAADEKMSRFPEFYKFLRKDNGKLYQVGDLWKNEELADTLRIIAKNGRDGFYKGEVAEKIVEMTKKYGGILTMEDLANYQPKVSKPVEGTYRGYKILSSKGGGTNIIEGLNILENFNMSDYDINSVERAHVLSEIFKQVYADREAYMADPFNTDVLIKGLTSKKYAKQLASKINMDYSQDYVPGSPEDYEHEDTTHFSVADKAGNMVAITQTVNLEFGSGVMVDGYGFVLNDAMADFAADADSVNAVKPGSEPLSSMSPTIILNEDGSPFLVIGTPGGSRIVSLLTQVISNVIDYDLSIEDAIKQPRIYDKPDTGLVLEDTVDSSLIPKLSSMGHMVSVYEGEPKHFGSVQAVMYKKDGTMVGGADERRDGKALGY